MGSTISSITSSMSARTRDDPMAVDDDEDEDPRPAKRRRTTQLEFKCGTARDGGDHSRRQPLGQVMKDNQQARSSRPELVQPYDFYGSSKHVIPPPELPTKFPLATTESNKTRIDDILPQIPANFTESLRVDVLEINPAFHIESEDLNLATSGQQSINLACRIATSIFYAQNDEKQGGGQDFTELCRLVKFCTLRVTVAANGEIAREFVKLEPFYFLPEHFYVKRKVRKPNGQWGGYERSFGFADKYRLSVSIESTKFHEIWPPLDISTDSGAVSNALDDGQFTKDDLLLLCKVNPLSDPDRQRRIALQVCHKNFKQSVPYTLNLQVRWALPSHLPGVVFEEPKNESPRVINPQPEASIPQEPTSPVPRRREDVSVENSPANNRAQRHRTDVQTYNLKTLSTLAQGKSPRKRKPKEPRSRSEQGGSDDGLTVTYSFGKADAVEAGVKQQTTISSLACPFCYSSNSSVEELRLHLHTDHGSFKFHLRRNAPRVQFFVEVAKSRSGSMSEIDRSKIFQLRKPKSLFDLDKYLAGDDGWAKLRHGPQHNMWPDHLLEKANESSLSSSPHGSRYSSPDTSNDTDDVMDFEIYNTKFALRPRKVHYVPETAKPLYDAITKRVLQPGEEIPGSDDEKDEGWLHQKQRDMVNDFTDVTAEEKDYINEWNLFIVEKHLTSDKYLPDAIVAFAGAKKDWFMENPSRKREFVKLMETFILRGVMDQSHLNKCIGILRAAEKAKALQKKEDIIMEDVEVEKPVSKKRGLGVCICGKFTIPPDRVTCEAPQCPARNFHRKCAKDFGRPLVKPWKCNECFSDSTAAA